MILMLGIGLGSALLLQVFGRRKGIRLNVIRSVLFFFCVNYFLVSGVKAFLGEPESTLLESLWDMDYRTCIHYGIPLCAAGVVLSFAIPVILRKKAEKCIDLFAAAIVPGGIAVSVIRGGSIDNRTFCMLFAVCAALAMVMAAAYKKDLLFFGKGEYVKGARTVLAQVGLSAVMLLLYFPGELFVGNMEEFPCSFWEFFGVLLMGALGCVVTALIVCLLFLPKGVVRFLNFLLFGLLVTGYLQALFLNGRLEIMDGGGQAWGLARQTGNIVIWIVLVSIVVTAGYRKRELERVYRTICIYIGLIQMVSLGYLVITADLTGRNQNAELTNQGALELSAKDNVVVFVLDRFESGILEEIMETDGAFLEPLSDFTFYDNATSQFSMTRSSIPHMLTGVPWNGEVPERYAEYAYEKSGALADMAQNGCHMGVYTAVRYYTPLLYGVTANYQENVEKHCAFGETMATMYRTSMYKVLPFLLKNAYAYYSTDINRIAASEEIWDIENDLPFYHSLIQKGLAVNGTYDKVFRFYHMMGAHEPYYLSEDMEYDKTGRQVTELPQSKASLKIVYEYMRQMKELGLYDDAVIIITADHGQRLEHAELVAGRPVKTSRPILLVKEAGAASEAMAVSSAPVSQENLIPTLLKAMGLDWHEYGRTLEEVPDDEVRERTYVDFDLIERYVVQYSIKGDARVLDSWDVKKEETY